MKMSKKTYRRIRKGLIFARALFLILFGLCAIFGALTANGADVLTTIIIFAAALVCFGISFFCDYLLGGYKSPFYH